MPSGESRVLLHYEDSHHLFTIMVVARASCNRVYDWVCVRVYVCVDRVDCVFVEDSCLRMVISGLLSHRMN